MYGKKITFLFINNNQCTIEENKSIYYIDSEIFSFVAKMYINKNMCNSISVI